jgi:hypothetical protein
MKHCNDDIIKLIDRFCAEAAKARSLPESLKAGREILALPPEGQRRIFLALGIAETA